MASQLRQSQLRLAFEDGSEVVAVIRPFDLIRAERHYGESARGHLAEATLYAAWCSLGTPGSPERTFDQWAATLLQFEESVGDVVGNPTNGAASVDAQQS